MIHKEFCKKDWINYGRWVQPPLSGCFWCYWSDNQAVKKLFQRKFHPIIFLDGNTLMHATDRDAIRKIIFDACKNNNATISFLEKYNSIAANAEKKHLAILGNTFEDNQKFADALFETYKEMVGVWWASIVGAILQEYIFEKKLAVTESEIEKHVEPFRRKTWIEEQSRDIRKISLEVKKEISKIDSTAITEKLISSYPEINRLVDKHVNTYSWFGTHHWMGDGYSRTKCIEDIKDQFSKKVHAKKTQKRPTGSTTDSLWKLMASMMYWRTHCAEVTAKVVFHSRDKLTEAAKKIGLDYSELLSLSFTEVLSLFSGGQKSSIAFPKNYTERNKAYGCYIDNGKETVITNKKLKKLMENLLEKVDTDIHKLRGTTASKGSTVQGLVRIIFSPRDFFRFQKGDILIAPETTPDFVPLMKIAKAIITEVGGVTSHAAIISRELGIPCITGTKIATQVLKDGDEVEVDANKGIVKVLRRA